MISRINSSIFDENWDLVISPSNIASFLDNDGRLVLRGEEFDNTLIYGLNFSDIEQAPIVIRDVHNVVLVNIVIDGGSGDGIVVKDSQDIALANIQISNVHNDGIVLDSNTNVSIQNTEIENTGNHGIHNYGDGENLNLAEVSFLNIGGKPTHLKNLVNVTQTGVGIIDDTPGDDTSEPDTPPTEPPSTDPDGEWSLIIDGSNISQYLGADGGLYLNGPDYDNVLIKDITIEGAEGDAITLRDVDNITLSNVTIADSGRNGVMLRESSGVTLSDVNILDSAQDGIATQDSSNLTFQNITIDTAGGFGIHNYKNTHNLDLDNITIVDIENRDIHLKDATNVSQNNINGVETDVTPEPDEVSPPSDDTTAPDEPVTPPVTDTPTPIPTPTPTPNDGPNNSGSHNWGGRDPNMYRGENYQGRDRDAGEALSGSNTYIITNDMTTAEIQAIIDTAPIGATIQFSEGEFILDDTLYIGRSDIAVIGAGEGKTVFNTSSAVFHNKPLFSIHPEGQSDYVSTGGLREKSTTTLSSAATKGSEVLRLDDVTDISSGDVIIIATATDKETIVEVDYVSGNSVHLKHKIAADFSTNEASVHVLDQDEHIISDVILKDFSIDYHGKSADVNRFWNHEVEYRGMDGVHSSFVSAIHVASAHEIDISNISMHDIGGNGITVFNALEVDIDNIWFDGSQNIGPRGAGYGVLVGNFAYSDIQNIHTTEIPDVDWRDNPDAHGPMRHLFVSHRDSTTAYNNIHVTYSNANSDFHGSAYDTDNLFYFEKVELYDKDDYVMPLFDYRHEDNEMNNTVIFDEAIATYRHRPEDYDPIKYISDNDNNDKNHPSQDDGHFQSVGDIVYISDNGGIIDTADKEDTIYGGRGDDEIKIGANDEDADKVYIQQDGGSDVIYQLETGLDKIFLESNLNNSGIENGSDVIARATQKGNDTVIDLGEGNQLTLDEIELTDLSSSDFVIF